MLEQRFRVAIESGLEGFMKTCKLSNESDGKPMLKSNQYISTVVTDFLENKPLLSLSNLDLKGVFVDDSGEEFTVNSIDRSLSHYTLEGVIAVNISSHLLLEENYASSFEEAEELRKQGIFIKFIISYQPSGCIDTLDLRLCNKDEIKELSESTMVFCHLKGSV